MTSLAQYQKKHKITIVKKLSSSKFTVYLAKSQIDSKFYAMKVFPFYNQDIHPSFARELKALPFEHKNVMKVVDFIPSIRTQCSNQEIGYSSYTLMELAPHGDLADFILSENFTRDDKLIRTLFHYICEGVEYIHSKNFAHMDLKLENVLLGENFIPKVSDFDTIKDLNKSRAKEINRLGTTNCRAPEIINQNCKDAFAADLYSLGVILIILQSGSLPYLENQHVNGFDFYTMLTESNSEYFKLHSLKDKLPCNNKNSFQELILGLTMKNPTKRMKFSDIKKNAWYSEPVYSESEYAEIMKVSS